MYLALYPVPTGEGTRGREQARRGSGLLPPSLNQLSQLGQRLVGNIKISVDALNVVMIVQLFDEAQHLASCVGVEIDRVFRNPGDLFQFDRDLIRFERFTD